MKMYCTILPVLKKLVDIPKFLHIAYCTIPGTSDAYLSTL